MFAMLDADADRKKRKSHQQPAEVNHQSSSARIQSADDVRDETGAWQNTASSWEYDYYRRRQIDHDYYRRRYHDYIHDYFTSAEEALTVEANAAAPEVTPPPAKAPPAVAEPEAAEAESSAGASVEEAKDAEPEVSPPVEALFPEDLPPPADPHSGNLAVEGGFGTGCDDQQKKKHASVYRRELATNKSSSGGALTAPARAIREQALTLYSPPVRRAIVSKWAREMKQTTAENLAASKDTNERIQRLEGVITDVHDALCCEPRDPGTAAGSR